MLVGAVNPTWSEKMIDEQISILTEDQLDFAVAQVMDVVEEDLDEDEVNALDERDIESICYDVGVKPTPQVIGAILARLDA
jgi:hypothetical protein